MSKELHVGRDIKARVSSIRKSYYTLQENSSPPTVPTASTLPPLHCMLDLWVSGHEPTVINMGRINMGARHAMSKAPSLAHSSVRRHEHVACSKRKGSLKAVKARFCGGLRWRELRELGELRVHNSTCPRPKSPCWAFRRRRVQ
jgi:hypothetical protein